LGHEINKIAYEKSGIIKENVEVVVPKNIRGFKVIEKVAKLKNADIFIARKCKKKIGLIGEYQKENAGLVIKAIEILNKKGFIISNENLERGLLKARWPGRMQYINDWLLFECAHNPKGMANLAKELKGIKKDVYFIIGIMKDKDIEGMCDEIKGLGKEYILVKPKIKRSAEPELIKEYLDEKIMIIPEIGKALEYAEIKAKNNGLVVVTGSIFTVGDCFQALGLEPFDS
jgi:dihydrofolate synthase/folylpolyglutamate synthase